MRALESACEFGCHRSECSRIQSKLRAQGEREVPSSLIGNLVMDELKQLDKVAYIRFASVYRC